MTRILITAAAGCILRGKELREVKSLLSAVAAGGVLAFWPGLW